MTLLLQHTMAPTFVRYDNDLYGVYDVLNFDEDDSAARRARISRRGDLADAEEATESRTDRLQGRPAWVRPSPER